MKGTDNFTEYKTSRQNAQKQIYGFIYDVCN